VLHTLLEYSSKLMTTHIDSNYNSLTVKYVVPYGNGLLSWTLSSVCLTDRAMCYIQLDKTQLYQRLIATSELGKSTMLVKNESIKLLIFIQH